MAEASFDFTIRPEPEVDFCREIAEQEQLHIAFGVSLQRDVTVTARHREYQFSVKISEKQYELTERIVKICLHKLLPVPEAVDALVEKLKLTASPPGTRVGKEGRFLLLGDLPQLVAIGRELDYTVKGVDTKTGRRLLFETYAAENGPLPNFPIELVHPNVVPYFSAPFKLGATTHLYYLPTEAYDNTLHGFLKGMHVLDLDMLIDLCKGLDFLHRQGIVHANISPYTIVVSSDDSGEQQLKIRGYGLPLRFYPKQHSVIGPYSAPEMAFGKPLTPTADVFSLGIILLRLLGIDRVQHGEKKKQCLRVAIKGITVSDGSSELLYSQEHQNLLNRHLEKSLAAIQAKHFYLLLRVMLQINPDNRFTMDRVLNFLVALRSEKGNLIFSSNVKQGSEELIDQRDLTMDDGEFDLSTDGTFFCWLSFNGVYERKDKATFKAGEIEFDILNRHSRGISMRPHALMSSNLKREILTLNPPLCPHLNEHLENIIGQIEKLPKKKRSPVKILRVVKDTVEKDIFPLGKNHAQEVEELISEAHHDQQHLIAQGRFSPQVQVPIMSVDEFVMHQVGICHIRSFTTAYLLDALLEAGHLQGTVKHMFENVGEGGHSWVIFIPQTSEAPQKWMLDTMCGVLENYAAEKGMAKLKLYYGQRVVSWLIQATQ